MGKKKNNDLPESYVYPRKRGDKPRYKMLKNKSTGKIERTAVFEAVLYTEDELGRPRRSTPYRRTRKEAKKLVDAANEARLTGTVSRSGGRTVKDLLDEYYANMSAHMGEEDGPTPATVTRHRSTATRLYEGLGHLPLDMAAPELAKVCNIFFEKVKAEGFRTVHKACRKVMRAAFDRALTHHLWIKVNPLSALPRARYKRKGRAIIDPSEIGEFVIQPTTATTKVRPKVEELKVIMTALQGGKPLHYKVHTWESVRLAIILAVDATIPVGEQRGLRWEAVHWEKGRGHILQQHTWENKTGPTKTPWRPRSFDLSPPVMATILPIWERQGRPKEGWVHATRTGQPLYQLSQYVGEFIKSLGFTRENPDPRYEGNLIPKFNLHDFRAAGGCEEHKRNGGNLMLTQQKMGHKPGSAVTPQHYLTYNSGGEVLQLPTVFTPAVTREGKWARENPEKNKERQRRYRAKNRDRILARLRDWKRADRARKKAQKAAKTG
jgi:hypothetical protein